ncbi:receptor-like protein EIX1 isoform X1 [Prosopis cineraria]|uniref:receptor-like protein EIX1 isoform X1 n=1 Tax=Prosopis cineraria TaxID=364024 RepID=UPI0024108F1E|nr:receptor-like protein EIX1 isoform X1 [Prosopis cineraria]
MSNNLLSGGLTNGWMYWKALVIIRLGDNNLSGSIPKWIGHNAKILQFRSNQISGNIPPEICQSESLIILDLAYNKISGIIPSCLHNMTAMRQASSSNVVTTFCGKIFCSNSIYGDNVMLHIKGLELIYEENVKFTRAIDLSNNDMSGIIPQEVFSLSELHSLNLSHNQFEGSVSKEIGKLNQLESLDLANNKFSGEIPRSLAQLSFLGTLNLSFNNFSRMIPLGTQLQGFDELSYIGNPELCGAPLPKNCSDKKDVKPIEENDTDQEDEFLASFYIASGVGFFVAFWGVCIAIFCISSFRNSYFRFLFSIRDKLYVMVALTMNRFG